jgi:4-amino-4-deoxy-L-arabinose transferase-like glycosyltransferase
VREILLTGSWAVLHDNGRPYVEKPPLYFWLGAVFSLPAGRASELAVRLPANLAAVLGLVVLFYLGRGLFGRRAGALAAIVMMTTQNYFMEARWAHPDMLWTLFLTFSCLAFHQAYRGGGDGPFWLGAFYTAIGLAVLTKGPGGLVLPLVAVLVFLSATHDLKFLRRMGLGWGLPLAFLPVLLWLVAYRASAGEAFPVRDALLRIGTRFTQGVHHPRPFYHLFTALAIDSLPWVVFLPAALWHTFPRRQSKSDRENAYIYSWITVLVAVFAFSVEKRGVYLLPLLPFLAILVGRLWDTALMGWEPSPVDRMISWSLWVGLLVAVGASAYVLTRVRREFPDLLHAVGLLGAAAILAALAAIATQRLKGGGTALAVFSAGVVGCFILIAAQVLPALDRYKSARFFSERVVVAVGGAPLGIYPDYRAAYAYYTRRHLETPRSREELDSFLRSEPRVYCLMEEDRFEIERRHLDVDLRILDRERVGHRAMLLVAAEARTAVERSPEGGG